MSATSLREEAKRLVEELPEGATWDDLIYRIYVRQKIDQGLKDSDEGHVVSQDEVERLFLGK